MSVTPPGGSATPDAPSQNPLSRGLWLGLGLLLVALGSIGAFVPGLPTTVFFIGAAACFARSSPRLERWVLGLPRIGPLVRDYRAGLGMPRRAKVTAVIAIAVAVALSLLAIPSWEGRVAASSLALVGIGYVAFRVPTREAVLAAQERGVGEPLPESRKAADEVEPAHDRAHERARGHTG